MNLSSGVIFSREAVREMCVGGKGKILRVSFVFFF